MDTVLFLPPPSLPFSSTFLTHPLNFLPFPLFPPHFPPACQLRQKAAWYVGKSKPRSQGHAWCLGPFPPPSLCSISEGGGGRRCLSRVAGGAWAGRSSSLPRSLSFCLPPSMPSPSLVLSFLPSFPPFLPFCRLLYLPQTQQPLDYLFEIPPRSFCVL